MLQVLLCIWFVYIYFRSLKWSYSTLINNSIYNPMKPSKKSKHPEEEEEVSDSYEANEDDEDEEIVDDGTPSLI